MKERCAVPEGTLNAGPSNGSCHRDRESLRNWASVIKSESSIQRSCNDSSNREGGLPDCRRFQSWRVLSASVEVVSSTKGQRDFNWSKTNWSVSGERVEQFGGGVFLSG